MKKKKLKISTLVVLFIILLIVFGVSIYLITHFYLDAYNNKKELDEVIKSVTNIDVIDDTKEEKFTVDFAALLKINKDVKGWIRFNKISYPILQAEDNYYYLDKTLNGKKNSLGSIFMDYRNKSFDDNNVVIFGHNAANGTMFGLLNKVFQKDYFVNNEKIIEIIDVNNNVLKYEIFSYYNIPKEEYYITTSFANDEEYIKFLDVIKKRSKQDFNTSIDKNDKILTLSTCNGYTGSNNRTVVHAKLLTNN